MQQNIFNIFTNKISHVQNVFVNSLSIYFKKFFLIKALKYTLRNLESKILFENKENITAHE